MCILEWKKKTKNVKQTFYRFFYRSFVHIPSQW